MKGRSACGVLVLLLQTAGQCAPALARQASPSDHQEASSISQRAAGERAACLYFKADAGQDPSMRAFLATVSRRAGFQLHDWSSHDQPVFLREGTASQLVEQFIPSADLIIQYRVPSRCGDVREVTTVWLLPTSTPKPAPPKPVVPPVAAGSAPQVDVARDLYLEAHGASSWRPAAHSPPR